MAVGCNLLALCAAKNGTPSSLYSIMRPLGRWWTLAVDINIVLQLFGTAIAYLIVVGDLMPAAFTQLGASGRITERNTCVLLAFLFAGPLSCPHNIGWLGVTSSFSVFFLIYTTFIVFLYSLPSDETGLYPCIDEALDDDTHVCVGSKTFGDDTSIVKFLQASSIFIFGFASQITVFPIVNELINVTQKRLNRVFMASTLTGMCLYIIVSFCAYATYGDSIQSNLLKNYPRAPVVSAARIMISFVVTFSYPLQINPTRRCILTILFNSIDRGVPASKTVQNIRYWVITVIFLIGSLGIALSVHDLGIVVALVGAFGGTLIMFILPGYLFLHHFPDKSKDGTVVNQLNQRLLDPTDESHDDIKDDDIQAIINAQNQSIENGREGKTLASLLDKDHIPVKVTRWDRFFAWVHLVLGIIIGPLCIIAIFV